MNNNQQLVFSAKDLAKSLDVSLRHIQRMNSAGKLPRPVKLGRCLRWCRDEISRWIEAGTPNRQTWETMKG